MSATLDVARTLISTGFALKHGNGRAAVARGWRVDQDGWWTRPLRRGDRKITDPAVGFLATTPMPGEPAGPYVRSAELALAYDEGRA